MRWDEYIGIPFKFNGSDYNGADCIGLVRLIYQERGWLPTFDDGKPVKQGWHKENPLRLVNYLCRHFNRVDNIQLLKEGDLIYFRDENGEGHVAIWVGYGKILHSAPSIEGISSTSHIGRMKHIQQSFVCAFARRVDDG